MKPYIEMKSGRDIFKATHVTVEPEMTPNREIMYCLVGYDMNNYRRKNLLGSSDLDRMISELAITTGQLVMIMERSLREKWEKAHEDK